LDISKDINPHENEENTSPTFKCGLYQSDEVG